MPGSSIVKETIAMNGNRKRFYYTATKAVCWMEKLSLVNYKGNTLP